MTLFAVNPQTTEGAIALERGAPLYFSWGGNGDSLLVHSRDEVKLLQRPFEPSRALLLANAAGFRTPALSLDGRKWAYSGGDASDSYISVGQSDDPAVPRRILDTGPLVAFMWSPDGRTLAVADNPDPQGRIFQRLRLVDADGSNLRTLAEEPLIAFYWAPNSERLAWVGVDAEEQVFRVGRLARWEEAAAKMAAARKAAVRKGAVRKGAARKGAVRKGAVRKGAVR